MNNSSNSVSDVIHKRFPQENIEDENDYREAKELIALLKQKTRQIREQRGEIEKFAKYVRKKWFSCIILREEINYRGREYFYNTYTTVPIRYSLYKTFCDDKNTCYCDQNCYANNEKIKKNIC